MTFRLRSKAEVGVRGKKWGRRRKNIPGRRNSWYAYPEKREGMTSGKKKLLSRLKFR